MNIEFLKKLFLEQQKAQPYIDKRRIENLVDDMFHFLFQLEDKRYLSLSALQNRLNEVKVEFSEILLTLMDDSDKVETIVADFTNALPELYELLLGDAQSIFENDPAARSLKEVKIAYPGFFAIAVYRFAHQLHKQEIELLPRLWTEYAHSKTGIDIHPGAQIGERFFIDHGTGIVIGESCIIGNEVKIYQGVTLGALSVSKDKANEQRHPVIEDRVVIYSNATILGGETRIGADSIIGGNVWLTHSVEPGTKVFHEAQLIIKDK